MPQFGTNGPLAEWCSFSAIRVRVAATRDTANGNRGVPFCFQDTYQADLDDRERTQLN